MEDKEGLVWKDLKAKFNLNDDGYMILESRGRNRKEINDLLNSDFEAFKKDTGMPEYLATPSLKRVLRLR